VSVSITVSVSGHHQKVLEDYKLSPSKVMQTAIEQIQRLGGVDFAELSADHSACDILVAKMRLQVENLTKELWKCQEELDAKVVKATISGGADE